MHAPPAPPRQARSPCRASQRPAPPPPRHRTCGSPRRSVSKRRRRAALRRCSRCPPTWRTPWTGCRCTVTPQRALGARWRRRARAYRAMRCMTTRCTQAPGSRAAFCRSSWRSAVVARPDPRLRLRVGMQPPSRSAGRAPHRCVAAGCTCPRARCRDAGSTSDNSCTRARAATRTGPARAVGATRANQTATTCAALACGTPPGSGGRCARRRAAGGGAMKRASCASARLACTHCRTVRFVAMRAAARLPACHCAH